MHRGLHAMSVSVLWREGAAAVYLRTPMTEALISDNIQIKLSDMIMIISDNYNINYNI
jgi:hypothetical protein